MKVICGDARQLIEDVPLEAFIISDPPYNQGYHYASYSDDLPPDDYAQMLLTVFRGRKSVIISYPEETIALFGGGRLSPDPPPASRQLGLQLQHREAASSRIMVELQT